MGDITYGGFFKSAVRKWIVRECLESGQPNAFFEAIKQATDDIDSEKVEFDNEADFWETQWDAVKE